MKLVKGKFEKLKFDTLGNSKVSEAIQGRLKELGYGGQRDPLRGGWIATNHCSEGGISGNSVDFYGYDGHTKVDLDDFFSSPIEEPEPVTKTYWVDLKGNEKLAEAAAEKFLELGYEPQEGEPSCVDDYPHLVVFGNEDNQDYEPGTFRATANPSYRFGHKTISLTLDELFALTKEDVVS